MDIVQYSSQIFFPCGCPPTPKPREEATAAEIVAGPYSNVLESTVGVLGCNLGAVPLGGFGTPFQRIAWEL